DDDIGGREIDSVAGDVVRAPERERPVRGRVGAGDDADPLCGGRIPLEPETSCADEGARRGVSIALARNGGVLATRRGWVGRCCGDASLQEASQQDAKGDGTETGVSCHDVHLILLAEIETPTFICEGISSAIREPTSRPWMQVGQSPGFASIDPEWRF